MKSCRSIFFISFLFLTLMLSQNAEGELMYKSNTISNNNLFIWDNTVIAVCSKEHFFARHYSFYSLSLENYNLLDTRSMLFNENEYYKTSKGLMLRKHVQNAAPFSYSVLKNEYSLCDEHIESPFGKNVFHELQVNKGDIIALSDGRLLRVQDNEIVSYYDATARIWKEVDLPCELIVNNLNFRDSCICINFAEAVYYSPSADSFHHFPAVNNKQLVNYILYDSSLIYSDIGGIYLCADGSSSAMLLFNMDNCNNNTEFCISNNVLYVYNKRTLEMHRWSLENNAPLPTLYISINPYNYCIFEDCIYSMTESGDAQCELFIFNLTTQSEKVYILN